MKISTTAWHAGVVIALVSGLFVLAVRGMPSGPFDYDEADYVYAATQGWFANWIDRPALNLVEFVRLGLRLGNDIHHRSELSEIIRKSGDVNVYRHWHGRLFYYWLGLIGLIGNWTLDERQLRLFSLLIPAAGAVLVYLGCFWVMPSSHDIAILAASLYATGIFRGWFAGTRSLAAFCSSLAGQSVLLGKTGSESRKNLVVVLCLGGCQLRNARSRLREHSHSACFRLALPLHSISL